MLHRILGRGQEDDDSSSSSSSSDEEYEPVKRTPTGTTPRLHRRGSLNAKQVSEAALMQRTRSLSRISQDRHTLAGIYLEGYLVKQGGSRGGWKTWRKAWFVLRPRGLAYFKNERAFRAHKPALGGILTTDMVSVQTHVPGKDTKHFALVAKNRTLKMRASSEAQKRSWISNLNMAIALASVVGPLVGNSPNRGGTSATPSPSSRSVSLSTSSRSAPSIPALASSAAPPKPAANGRRPSDVQSDIFKSLLRGMERHRDSQLLERRQSMEDKLPIELAPPVMGDLDEDEEVALPPAPFLSSNGKSKSRSTPRSPPRTLAPGPIMDMHMEADSDSDVSHGAISLSASPSRARTTSTTSWEDSDGELELGAIVDDKGPDDFHSLLDKRLKLRRSQLRARRKQQPRSPSSPAPASPAPAESAPNPAPAQPLRRQAPTNRKRNASTNSNSGDAAEPQEEPPVSRGSARLARLSRLSRSQSFSMKMLSERQRDRQLGITDSSAAEAGGTTSAIRSRIGDIKSAMARTRQRLLRSTSFSSLESLHEAGDREPLLRPPERIVEEEESPPLPPAPSNADPPIGSLLGSSPRYSDNVPAPPPARPERRALTERLQSRSLLDRLVRRQSSESSLDAPMLAEEQQRPARRRPLSRSMSHRSGMEMPQMADLRHESTQQSEADQPWRRSLLRQGTFKTQRGMISPRISHIDEDEESTDSDDTDDDGLPVPPPPLIASDSNSSIPPPPPGSTSGSPSRVSAARRMLRSYSDRYLDARMEMGMDELDNGHPLPPPPTYTPEVRRRQLRRHRREVSLPREAWRYQLPSHPTTPLPLSPRSLSSAPSTPPPPETPLLAAKGSPVPISSAQRMLKSYRKRYSSSRRELGRDFEASDAESPPPPPPLSPISAELLRQQQRYERAGTLAERRRGSLTQIMSGRQRHTTSDHPYLGINEPLSPLEPPSPIPPPPPMERDSTGTLRKMMNVLPNGRRMVTSKAGHRMVQMWLSGKTPHADYDDSGHTRDFETDSHNHLRVGGHYSRSPQSVASSLPPPPPLSIASSVPPPPPLSTTSSVPPPPYTPSHILGTPPPSSPVLSPRSRGASPYAASRRVSVSSRGLSLGARRSSTSSHQSVWSRPEHPHSTTAASRHPRSPQLNGKSPRRSTFPRMSRSHSQSHHNLFDTIQNRYSRSDEQPGGTEPGAAPRRRHHRQLSRSSSTHSIRIYHNLDDDSGGRDRPSPRRGSMPMVRERRAPVTQSPAASAMRLGSRSRGAQLDLPMHDMVSELDESSGMDSGQDTGVVSERLRALFDELVGSERRYVDHLSNLVTLFFEPLQSSTKMVDLRLDYSDVNAIFSNVESLYNTHQLILHDFDMREHPLGVLHNKARFLQGYLDYARRYGEGLRVLNRLVGNSRFQKFVRKQRKRTDGLDLVSYLIMPIQRIPRYELLLEAMAEEIPDTHPLHHALQRDLGTIRALNVHTNEHRRELANESNVLLVQQRISGLPERLLAPNRRLERSGTVTIKSDSIFKKFELADVYLFNDILIWATASSGKFKGWINIDEAQIDTHHVEQMIGVMSPSGSITMFFDKRAVMSEWLQSVVTCVSTASGDMGELSPSDREEEPLHRRRSSEVYFPEG